MMWIFFFKPGLPCNRSKCGLEPDALGLSRYEILMPNMANIIANEKQHILDKSELFLAIESMKFFFRLYEFFKSLV